jgi:hypothetical protein
MIDQKSAELDIALQDCAELALYILVSGARALGGVQNEHYKDKHAAASGSRVE